MNKEKEKFDSITPKIVLGQLFKSRNIMHIVHLKNPSFAVHTATQMYYEKILTLTDELAEVHFGITGKKDIDSIPAATYIDPTQHINDISYYMESNRKLFKTSEEQNIIDEMLSLMGKTKFLLTPS